MDFLDKILEFLNSGIGQAGVIAMVLEFAFRLIKTPVPLSIAHLVAKTLKKVAEIAGKLAEFLDKVLPQKVEAPAPAAEQPKA